MVTKTGSKNFFPDLLQKSKKNYIKENMKQLKALEKKQKLSSSALKCEERAGVWPGGRPTVRRSQRRLRVSTIAARSSSELRRPRSPATLMGMEARTRRPPATRHPAYRTQGSQTVSDEEDVLSSGTILYPSEEAVAEAARLRKDFCTQTIDWGQGSQAGDYHTLKEQAKVGEEVDFIRLNQMVQYKKKGGKEDKDPIRPPPSYQLGVLPKYLREQKKSAGKSAGSGEAPQVEDPCPPGHVLLAETERKDRLRHMRKHYADLVNKLNLLPARPTGSTALRIRQKRAELQNEMDKLESDIRLFSKEKLYIRINP